MAEKSYIMVMRKEELGAGFDLLDDGIIMRAGYVHEGLDLLRMFLVQNKQYYLDHWVREAQELIAMYKRSLEEGA